MKYSQQRLLKKTPTQMFSSEYCEIFKNTYFEEYLLTAASDFFETATEQRWAAGSDNLVTGSEQLSH